MTQGLGGKATFGAQQTWHRCPVVECQANKALGGPVWRKTVEQALNLLESKAGEASLGQCSRYQALGKHRRHCLKKQTKARISVNSKLDRFTQQVPASCSAREPIAWSCGCCLSPSSLAPDRSL